MKTIPTNYTVSDYCDLLNRNEITVNRDYQRSDKVWPNEARSFLVETVILDYPMPKLSLHQRIDLKTRKTFKEIVDGQQRSMAIVDFYNDRYTLSNKLQTPNLRGRLYSQLEEEDQEKFISYMLSVDLFTNTNESEIREVFRRMNSYTIPLNHEERRHSTFQGEFKWYIYDLTKLYDNTLINIGVFNEKQIARMSDAKLFSDITLALIQGIKTTTASALDNAYKVYDSKFPDADRFEREIQKSIDFIVNMPEIHKTPLMKPQVIYGLVLAINDVKNKSNTILDPRYAIIKHREGFTNRGNIASNLTLLAEAISDPSNAPAALEEFIASTSRTTNEIRRRSVVFEWLRKALTYENIMSLEIQLALINLENLLFIGLTKFFIILIDLLILVN